MKQILVSPQAMADQAEIWLRIARHSPQAADRLAAEIERAVQTLAEFPGLGELCENLGPGLRASSVGSYVIYYRSAGDFVEVLRVIHGARDIQSLFDPRIN